MSGHVGHPPLGIHSDQPPAAAPLGVSGEHQADTEAQGSDNCHVLQTLPVRSEEPRPLRVARYGRVADHPPVTQFVLACLIGVFSGETCNKITQYADVVAV